MKINVIELISFIEAIIVLKQLWLCIIFPTILRTMIIEQKTSNRNMKLSRKT